MAGGASAVRHAAQVAVVGAGPAGLAAAIEAARAGARVVVVDEGYRTGGQIYRQMPEGFGGQHDEHGSHSPGHAKGAALLAEFAGFGIEVLARATVWDAARGRVSFEQAGEAHVVDCERLVLATGAYDRCVPFPGWTLPGVITAGAAQVMVRGFAVEPGVRALVVGTGPLLLPTVTALLSAKATVVAACEANGRGAAMRAGLGMLRSGARLREAFYYLRALRKHRVDHRFGWGIVRAEGDVSGVRAAVIARLDGEGRVVKGTEQRHEVDVVCVGYGLLPSIELARVLGCEMHHVPVRGGWLPVHDASMETSVDGVFVAGEIAGIGGADVAAAEGRLAGIAAARSLGLGDGADCERRARAAQRVRAKERAVSDALLGAFDVLPGLYDLADDQTIVCRCEDVTFSALRECARVFGGDMRSLKMGSRAGMGPCQARICQTGVHALAQRRLGGAAGVMPCPVVQVPVKPVSIGTIVATETE